MNPRLRSLAAQLRGVAREWVARPATSEIEWPGGVKLTGLRPVKPVRGHVINKFNRVVLRGDKDGTPIKLYEAVSIEHATFLEALAKHAAVARWFPPMLGRSGRSLLARWIDGATPPDDVALRDIVELQAALHTTPASALPPSGFDFWADHVRPRFVRAADMIGVTVDDMVALVDAENARPRRVLVHLDLKPANLIVDAAGVTYSVDNESCSASALPLLDVCHTARGMRAQSRAYWRAYRDKVSCDLGQSAAATLQAAWVARLVGSSFVAGRLADAARTIRDHRAGMNLLPFDLD